MKKTGNSDKLVNYSRTLTQELGQKHSLKFTSNKLSNFAKSQRELLAPSDYEEFSQPIEQNTHPHRHKDKEKEKVKEKQTQKDEQKKQFHLVKPSSLNLSQKLNFNQNADIARNSIINKKNNSQNQNQNQNQDESDFATLRESSHRILLQ